MSEAKQNGDRSADKLLDLLLDALEERLAARREGQERAPLASKPIRAAEAQAASAAPAAPAQAAPVKRTYTPPPRPEVKREPQPGDPDWTLPTRVPSIQLDVMIKRLLLLVLGLTILFNIPVTRYGVSLARIMPDTASMIIRDGLVLKGAGPEIYVLEDNKLRWISSLDAFQHLDYRWSDVHEVSDDFLAEFEIGEPIHVLLKCPTSPHVYRLENGQKRWIKDIDTFVAEGHVWEDVKMVDCYYLRSLPTGLPIPEDAGPSPEP